MTDINPDSETLLALTADIVSAHVGNNSVGVGDLPALIVSVHAALSKLGAPAVEEAPAKAPAVSVRASIRPDYLVCLEDGKKLKMLKRHLMTHYQLTPAEYRAKWGLPADYPMVAPNYAESRRTLAKAIGLGRKKTPEPAAKPAPQAKAKAPARAKKAAAPATGAAAETAAPKAPRRKRTTETK
ncbi:MAG TPA: MucR family transcriptional regulator [Sphingomonadaceae bacterium]|nr:MucR family transcriptional regulator [Sphingomonadaceae bacterium]